MKFQEEKFMHNNTHYDERNTCQKQQERELVPVIDKKMVPFTHDNDFRSLIQKYFAEEVGGMSPHTVRAKMVDLKKWVMWYECRFSGDGYHFILM